MSAESKSASVSREAKLKWVSAHHHPVLEVITHTCSPLSAAMSIWAMQKFWQIPALRAVVRGRWIRIVTAIKNSTHTSSGLVRWKRSCKSSTKVTRAEQQQRTADTQSHTVSGMVVMTTIHPAQDSPLMAQLLQKYNGSDAAMVLEHVSFSKTVLQVQEALEWLHATSGLPWWAVIASATLLSRIVIMPINVSAMKNSLRLKVITPQTEKLYQQISCHNNDSAARVLAAQQVEKLLIHHKCHPLHHWWVPIVFPLAFLSYFGAIHNLCLTNPSMSTEGMLWFQDLMVADTTFVLPVMSSLTWLWTVELGGGTLYRTWPGLKSSTRIVALASIPIVAIIPAGVFMFWIPANLYAVARSYTFRSDRVRNWLAIPTNQTLNMLPHLPHPVPLAIWPRSTPLNPALSYARRGLWNGRNVRNTMNRASTIRRNVASPKLSVWTS